MALSALAVVSAVYAISNNNGAGRTPPMGWRNWNFFQGAITQDLMEAQMGAMSKATRHVAGRDKAMSLVDLGYSRAGLDDNWQRCHSGIHGPGDSPGSFHNASGWPLINTSRFPDMRAMVDFGHAQGLMVGWYDNNCICGEGSSRLTPDDVHRDVAGNVKYIQEIGFDGLKADGCGPGRNMTRLAELLNETGRPILIENCHYNKLEPGEPMPKGMEPDPGRNRIFPYWKDNVTGGELICPENTFRSSGDIRNSWESWFGNLESLNQYLDPVHPISQPGCWAYADMLMVGVFASTFAPDAGPAASLTEWRSHFGAWAIVSSPLILSFDLTNETTMDSVWPFISNVEAIGVNQAWGGHPGRQVLSNRTHAVWAKRLTQSTEAVLVVNMATEMLDFDLEMALFGQAPNALVRDVWEHKATAADAGTVAIRALASHDSKFFILGDDKLFAPEQST